MDAERFDALTRSLPLSGSRRGALAAMLGVTLGLLGMENTSQSAPKKCKKLKGKKKKKCLKKLKAAGCQQDADCPDQIESCQGGRCRRVCQNGSCPGCDLCLIHYEAAGDRTRRCAGSAEIPALLTSCATDTDCPNEAPLCISFAETSCTEEQCGTCVESTGSCDEPECVNDADCTDLTQSCQSGECRPVCPSGSCPGCSFCVVRFEADGDRTQTCAESLSASSGAIDCTTDAGCPPQDPTCVGVSAALCDQPPCRQCFSVVICTP